MPELYSRALNVVRSADDANRLGWSTRTLLVIAANLYHLRKNHLGSLSSFRKVSKTSCRLARPSDFGANGCWLLAQPLGAKAHPF